jgi:dienelactone hydrolase
MHARTTAALAALAGLATLAPAAVKTEPVEYAYDGKTFKGMLAYDDAAAGKRPGVLVVHEWWGLNDHARDRAEKLAGLGYVAFACDMYGDGKTTSHPKEAGEFAGEVRKNQAAWAGRAKAALKVLRDSPKVDPTKLAAVGFCFGGSTAQLLAFAGADVDAVVSFHGAPVVPTADQAKAAKARILMCHGGADPFIKQETIDAFKKALDAGGAKYEWVSYPGVVHSFTAPGADKVGNPGMKYDEKADKESWAAMRKLFDEAFAGK